MEKYSCEEWIDKLVKEKEKNALLFSEVERLEKDLDLYNSLSGNPKIGVVSNKQYDNLEIAALKKENEELKKAIEKALNKDEATKILKQRISDLNEELQSLKDRAGVGKIETELKSVSGQGEV